MSKYLVSGGAGFVGSAVAKKLLDLGHEVFIIDNLSTGFKENVPLDATFILGDCSKLETINQLKEQYFDAIFHIAGQSSGEISFEDPLYDIHCNTVSTLLLLQFAVKTNCKHFIYASTMSVYGDHPKQKVSELDETNPKSFYAIGKLASEKYLKVYFETYGVNYTTLRYFNIYGPGQNMLNMKQGMISIFLKQLIDPNYSEIVVKGSLERFRDFIYIDDLVDITISSLGNNQMLNELFNVGTGYKTSIREVLDIMMKVSKIYKPIKVSDGTLGDQFGIFANNSKLKQAANITFTPLEKGVELFWKSISINEK
jgi:UDP-glucose 4-epimerase